LIKDIDIHRNTSSFQTERNKIQYFDCRLVIFLFVFTLFSGSAATGFNASGQSNDFTSFQENESPPIISDTQLEENASSSFSSSDNDDQSATTPELKQTEENLSDSQPGGDCLFDPSLPKCAPDENGNCPEGFSRNGDDQCYPRHDRCPEGYHSHEDDESGRCIPDNVPCDPGFIMNPDYPSCENKDRVCQDHHDLEICKEDDVTNNLSYRSGYSHGCSDSKVSDTSERYINQPGKGPGYHTNEFLRGYNDGFESCSGENNSLSPSTSKGAFKVIVEVSNQSPIDIDGSITISVDHDPENIFKSAYGIYFPSGHMTSKTFTNK
jgi:hypothetical protein